MLYAVQGLYTSLRDTEVSWVPGLEIERRLCLRLRKLEPKATSGPATPRNKESKQVTSCNGKKTPHFFSPPVKKHSPSFFFAYGEQNFCSPIFFCGKSQIGAPRNCTERNLTKKTAEPQALLLTLVGTIFVLTEPSVYTASGVTLRDADVLETRTSA